MSVNRPTWGQLDKAMKGLVDEGVVRSFEVGMLRNGCVSVSAIVDQGTDVEMAEIKVRAPLEAVLPATKLQVSIGKRRASED